MSTEDNLALVRRAYECFGRGDLPGILELLTDDVSWHSPAVDGAEYYGEKTGKDGATEFFVGLGSRETAPEFVPRDFFANGDKVVVLGRWAATVSETGKRWESDWSHTFTIRDGKISAWRELFDNLAATRAFAKSSAA